MTLSEIKTVLKTQLKFFNSNKVEISDDTIHEDVLDKVDQAEEFKIKTIFKGNVLWSLWKNKHGKKKFPSNWTSLSVADLAQKLLIFILMMVSCVSYSQIKMNVSAVRTDLKQTAIQFAFNYLKSVDSAISNQDQMIFGKKSYLIFTPDIEFRTGSEDAFSSVNAKATGMLVKFKTMTVDGIEMPNADKTLHVFPISVGAETNNQFNFINGLVEAGYSPFYQSETRDLPDFIRRTKFGVYLQGGYKFKIDSSSTIPIGGMVDESEESVEDAIFRAKGTFSIDSKKVASVGGIKIGLVGSSDVWYDILNKAFYYRLEGVARLYLTTTMYFDLMYQKGSGAPNFNQGSQWGVGLTVNY